MKKLLLTLLLLSVSLACAQTLRVAQGADATTIDAQRVTDVPSGLVTRQMVETLFDPTPEGEIVPLLAESYEVSEDGLTWTLSLRQGVLFHDGTPFNAEAVRFNLERLIDPTNGFAFAFLINRISAIETPDEHTVVLQLTEPFAPLIAHLSHGSTGIQSPAAILEYGEDYGNTISVGTGPFRFGEWVRGQYVQLSRNEDYWGDLPETETLRFLSVPESTTRMALVEAGEVDIALRVPPQDVTRLQANPDLEVVITPSVRTVYVYFNMTQEPFTDLRVRQAINHAVNKEEIVEFVLGGAGRVSDAPVSPGVFGYTPVGSYDYDSERARALLTEAGYADGFSTVLYSPTGRYLQDIQVMEVIQGQLAEVGINATIETLEWSAYLALTARPADENIVEAAMYGWGVVTTDADYGLFPLFHSTQHVPNGSNRGFYSNPDVDALLSEARANPDPEVRLELYDEAMTLLWEDAPWLFLHSELQLTAVRNNIEGLVIFPTERLAVAGVRLRAP